MRPTTSILSFMSCPALLHISALSHKRQDLSEKITEHKMCVFTFSTTFNVNIFHSNKNSALYYHKCTLVFT